MNRSLKENIEQKRGSDVSEHLVVIDMQHVFGDPSSPWCTPRFAEVVGPIQQLVAGYEPRLVFTRFVAPPSPDGAWVDYYRQWPFALQPPDATLFRLVEPFAERHSLAASTFGKWGPELAELVGDSIAVAGVSTDCCVISTVLAAADAGIRVRVAADACAGASDETHQQALAIMALYVPLVEVTTTESLLG